MDSPGGKLFTVSLLVVGGMIVGWNGKELLDVLLIERRQQKRILEADMQTQRRYINKEFAQEIAKIFVEQVKKTNSE